MADLEGRLDRLRELTREQRAAAVVLPEHVYYLTGIEPLRDHPALVLVTEEEVRAWWPDEVPAETPAWIQSRVYARWPVTEAHHRHSFAAAWSNVPTGAALDAQPVFRPLFRELVRPKEPEEVAVIETNVRDNDGAFRAVSTRLREGSSDLDVLSWAYEALARAAGEAVAWQGDIGLGARGGYFGAQAGGAVAARGDLLFVDLYSRRRHYAGDSTRTFVVGEPEPWMERAHSRLERALGAVEELIRPGAAAGDLDAACRGILNEGASAPFPHHSGHGLGLFAQEPPYLVPENRDLLREGEVVAVEPGLYFEGVGGMRLEDVFEVTSGGCRRLNTYPRNLVVCK
jgi:Xaa-Pro aminopeptidase